MKESEARLSRQTLSVLLAVLLLALNLQADRTRLKPGMNFFKPEQDVELGREAAQEAERQLPLLNNARVDAYLNELGKRLTAHAPGYHYPYQFKAVNDSEINAFALPGGFLYVNRGTIEAADNEAQLAGVMAHEISHVVLRHGTNQLSKAMLAQAPLAVLGGLAGSGGNVAGQLAQLGIEVGFTGIFLKFSRTAETQADVLGTQILNDSGYDPKAMAEFFETLKKEHKGQSIQFFSSHPNPENREKRIEQEIALLGPQQHLRRDSEEFRSIQALLRELPPAPKAREKAQGEAPKAGRPGERPSERLAGYRHRDFDIRYPENWKVYESGTQVVFAPAGGVGENAVAYGVMANVLDLEDAHISLEVATDRLVRQILQSNQGMREVSHQSARVGGRQALATQLSGRSPIKGETESDWIFTVRLRDNSLFYAIFIVPESDYRTYQPTFQQMLDSVRFR